MKLAHLFAAALLLAGVSQAQEQKAAAVPLQKPAYAQKTTYPLTTCVVSGEDLEADAVTFEAGGRTFRTCCPKCEKKVEKDPETFAKKLDAAVTAAQAAHYPLAVCPVSGEKLGGMGEPVVIVIDNTLVKLCCPKCEKKARADSAKIVQKIHDAAFAAQMQNYPLKTCVVSGEALDATAVSTMFDTTLVRTCCDKCVAKIEKEPTKFLSKLAPQGEGKEAAPKKGEAKGEGKEKEKGVHGKSLVAGAECCCDDGKGAKAEEPCCCAPTAAKKVVEKKTPAKQDN